MRYKKLFFMLLCMSSLTLTGCGIPNIQQQQNSQQQNEVEHTVTFDSKGGSSVASQKVKHGENATKPSDPTKTGHMFVDWVDENDDHWSFNGYTITRDLTLYATWVANQHTVKFDSKGGSSIPSQTINHGEHAIKPSDPNKQGYTFVSWVDENDDDWSFTDNAITDDMTLYAKWTVKIYSVTYNSNGGSNVTTQHVAHGDFANRPINPTRLGYSFVDWKDENGNTWLFNAYPITSNITLNATWAINTYTITFDSLGGSSVVSQTVAYGEHLSKPEDPEKVGFTFVKWVDEYNATWSFENCVVNQNLTLYAQWVVKQYTVTFNSNGGTSVPSQEVTHGSNAHNPPAPTKSGYTFVDWVDENGDHWSFNGYTITSDITLYANWSANEYSVTFVNNDGTELDHQILSYNSQIVYQGETPEYVNPDERYIYDFVGWDKPLVVPAENIVLTAQYETTFISGKVSFYNYDETLIEEYNIVEGQPMPQYQGETPTRAASGGLQYQFINWKEADDSSVSHVKYIAQFGTCSNGLVFDQNSIVSYSGTSSEVVIPAKWNGYDITRIASEVFRGNTFIQRITIPGSIKLIEYWCFAECSLLSEVVIEDGVETIYDHAFYACPMIETIVLPDSVRTLTNSAFDSCTNLKNVQLSNSLAKIEGETFRRCTSLTEITIPDSVKTIAQCAFDFCEVLTTVHIGKGLMSFGEGVFEYDLALSTFDIDEENEYLVCENGIVYDISKTTVFVAAKTLTGEVTIPSSVLQISKTAFFTCEKITSVIIQDGAITIDKLAFAYCTNLESIRLPNTLKNIGQEALRNCPKLTSCYIPEGVSNLPTHIFEGCETLEWIYLPSTLQSISAEAYFYCWSVNKVFYNGSEEDWAKVSKHENESYCGDPEEYFYSETEPTETGNYWHFVSGTPTVW